MRRDCYLRHELFNYQASHFSLSYFLSLPCSTYSELFHLITLDINTPSLPLFVSEGCLWKRDRSAIDISTRKDTTFTKDSHDLSGSRARSPIKRAAVDPRFRLRGRWDRLTALLSTLLVKQNRGGSFAWMGRTKAILAHLNDTLSAVSCWNWKKIV